MKLNSGGISRPLGKVRLPSMRSSSKNGCAQAFRGVIRALGVYSSSWDTKLIASVGVRIRKTCGKYSSIRLVNLYFQSVICWVEKRRGRGGGRQGNVERKRRV